MTPKQHRMMAAKLERDHAKLIAKKKQAGTLNEKLVLIAEARIIADQLHQHRLNYYELVPG